MLHGMPTNSSNPAAFVRIEAAALSGLADRLESSAAALDALRRALTLLESTAAAGHRIVLTGMGKSGIIARKIAATLRSTGAPAHFLHPAEALHGDLGMLAAGDVAIALSYSGETAEILALLPAFVKLGTPIVTFTGSPASTLAKASFAVFDVGVAEEACPLNLAPTASTTVMLALGDALALELGRLRGLDPHSFADLHPGGMLGRRLARVGDLMHSGEALPKVEPATPMPQVIYEMSRKKLGMTTVLDREGNLLGMISDGDLRRLLEREGSHALEVNAGKMMNESPLTIAPETFASDALSLMERRKITSLIVVEGAKVLGVVHLHDLFEAGSPSV
jgi:arabinose-5-phosphate isomerase